jgi:hypothetical protein
MKLEKLKNIPQVVVFVCLPLPTRTRTQEYICKNLKQDIKVSNTLFQKTKIGSGISSIVFFSFHSRHIFSLILVVGPNGHNSNSFNLLFHIREQNALVLGL